MRSQKCWCVWVRHTPGSVFQWLALWPRAEGLKHWTTGMCLHHDDTEEPSLPQGALETQKSGMLELGGNHLIHTISALFSHMCRFNPIPALVGEKPLGTRDHLIFTSILHFLCPLSVSVPNSPSFPHSFIFPLNKTNHFPPQIFSVLVILHLKIFHQVPSFTSS